MWSRNAKWIVFSNSTSITCYCVFRYVDIEYSSIRLENVCLRMTNSFTKNNSEKLGSALENIYGNQFASKRKFHESIKWVIENASKYIESLTSSNILCKKGNFYRFTRKRSFHLVRDINIWWSRYTYIDEENF